MCIRDRFWVLDNFLVEKATQDTTLVKYVKLQNTSLFRPQGSVAVRDEGLARRPLVYYVPSFRRAPAVGTTDVLDLGCGLLPAVGDILSMKQRVVFVYSFNVVCITQSMQRIS